MYQHNLKHRNREWKKKKVLEEYIECIYDFQKRMKLNILDLICIQ